MKHIVRPFFVTLAILCVPLLAMEFDNGVNWGGGDFLVMGVLLLGAGIIIEFVLHTLHNRNQRILAAVAIILIVLLIWVDLAVGIFNIPGVSGS